MTFSLELLAIKDTRRKNMFNALFSCLEKLCLNLSKLVGGLCY